MAHALTQSLQQAMVARYREVFSSTALPAFERSTRELLHQINGTFSTGTKECEYEGKGWYLGGGGSPDVWGNFVRWWHKRWRRQLKLISLDITALKTKMKNDDNLHVSEKYQVMGAQ